MTRVWEVLLEGQVRGGQDEHYKGEVQVQAGGRTGWVLPEDGSGGYTCVHMQRKRSVCVRAHT